MSTTHVAPFDPIQKTGQPKQAPTTIVIENFSGSSGRPLELPAVNDARQFNYSIGDISNAIELALRQTDLDARIRIHNVSVKPAYAADDDEQLLTATVIVKIGLAFPTPEEPS